jgi:hypothetical protein
MGNIVIANTRLSDAGTFSNKVSTHVNFPIEQLQFVQPSQKWRTTTITGVYFTIDLGNASTIWDTIALIGHNCIVAAATWRIRFATSEGNLTSSPTYDSGNVSMQLGSVLLADWASRTSVHFKSSAATGRWMRIDISDPFNSDGYVEIGRLLVGAKWQPTINMAYGWSLGFKDHSKQNESLAGGTFIAVRPKQRIIKFTLDFQSEDDMYDNAFDLDRLIGESGDVLIVPDPEEAKHIHRQTIHGVMKGLKPITNTRYNIYRKPYEIRELL